MLKNSLTKLRDWTAVLLMQWGITSTLIGVLNFLMISWIYLKSVGLTPWFALPIIMAIVIFGYVLNKGGFISALFRSQHNESPVLMEILERVKRLEEKK